MLKPVELLDKIPFERKGREKLYVGYDIGNGQGEISYFTEHQLKPESLQVRADAIVYRFPCLLVKMNGRFVAGLAAKEFEHTEGADVFYDVFQLSLDSTSTVVNGRRYDTAHLLGVFISLTLKQLESIGSFEKIAALMFTTGVPVAQEKLQEVLQAALGNICSKKTKIYVQSRTESVYYYMLSQEKELWEDGTIVCDFHGAYLRSFYMKKIGAKIPSHMKLFIEEHRELERPKQSLAEFHVPKFKRQLDEGFKEVVKAMEASKNFASVFLIGDGFKGEWMEESLHYLSEDKRVFLGNNLYSLGAAYHLLSMIEEDGIYKQYELLDVSGITYDIGFVAKNQGLMVDEDYYYVPVFEGGTSYEECKESFVVVVDKGEALQIQMSSILQEEKKEIKLDLSSFTKDGEAYYRLQIEFKVLSPETLTIEIQNIGFGDVVRGSNMVVTENINLE